MNPRAVTGDVNILRRRNFTVADAVSLQAAMNFNFPHVHASIEHYLKLIDRGHAKFCLILR